ncbi:glycosyltransferase [Clostridium swellfunianum]|uniref:glycosyltransferase n=1 Tax=Clostridium swellfunianum TaxID=1367462 RepID=UPI00202FB233|nr:glycosyltransferase [Clostridium swellfunianum]MCM0650581.1 glycosyltransferase [Clostridium swellfunianum]
MRINVLHIVANGKLSGAEKVVSDICTNIDTEMFHPLVVCTQGELVEHFKSRHVDCFNADVNKMEISKLRSILVANKVHIIHAHDVKASIAGYLASINLKIPVISHIHSSYPWMKTKSPLKYIDRFFRNKYTLSIACSQKAAEYYFEYNKSLDKSKMIVKGNMFNFRELAQVKLQDEKEMKRKFFIDSDTYVFGYLGRLLESKGVDLLIESFYNFSLKNDKAVLLIVGDGEYMDKLKDLVSNYKLEDKVIFAGYQKDVYSYLNVFDSFILPSRYEGLPISVLEAMAMERVVISTPTAGVPEVIDNNYSGILLKERSMECLLEAMEYVYFNRDKAEEMGKNAKAFLFEHRNIKNYIVDLQKLYAKISSK